MASELEVGSLNVGSGKFVTDSSGNVTQKGDVLKVERTDNAPSLQLYNNHASPADGAALGYVSFTGKDNNGTSNQTYANIGGFCESNTDSNVSGYLTFNTTSAGTATTERMRIASTGKVTVNLADAGTYLNVGSGNHRQLRFTSYDTTSANAGHTIDASSTNGEMKLATGGTARLTIDSSGVINIPNLSASSDVQTDGSKNLITSSDKRLKNDIGELTAGLDIVSNLEPHYFSWKSDITNTQQLGFYAQDVYEFLPEAAPREQKQNLVTPAVSAAPATYYEEGDELPEGKVVGDEKTPAVEAVDAVYEPATNEDGTPDYNWGFNGRPIIAALVAAVKELKAKVEALEGGE